MKTYKDNSLILENTEKLKQCVDSKLTEEDKAHATAFIVSLSVWLGVGHVHLPTTEASL